MSNNFLEDCILEWGIKASIINKTYKEALYEANHFNKKHDLSYIKECMSIILDRGHSLFVDKFIESKHYNLKKFIEELYDEPVSEEIMSTDFAPDSKPQGGHKYYTDMELVVSDENQDENNREASI